MALGSQWCHQDPLGGLFPICLSSWLGFLAPFVWAEIFGNCIYWCVTHILWNGNLAVSTGDKVLGNSFIPAYAAIWIKSVFPTLQGKLISRCQSSCDCPRRVLWLRSDFMCDISLTILISKIVIFFINFFLFCPHPSHCYWTSYSNPTFCILTALHGRITLCILYYGKFLLPYIYINIRLLFWNNNILEMDTWEIYLPAVRIALGTMIGKYDLIRNE